MENLSFKNTSWENGSNHSNMSLNKLQCFVNGKIALDPLAAEILNWMNWISIAVGLPLIFIVMISIYFQVKKGQGAPVYIINLLVSDVIQLCSRIPVDLTRLSKADFLYMRIVYYGILASVGFMVCVSCERYLIVAKPLWYRFKRNIKKYVVVCIVVWILPILYPILGNVMKQSKIASIYFIVFTLLPFPFFIFFLVGTIKALSGALTVPADEKRRITAIQVMVMFNYTLLYLPIIILLLFEIEAVKGRFSCTPYAVGYAGGCLSPLADTILYVLIRKSILDKFLASICSCKISENQETSSTDHESRTVTNTETV